MGYGCFVAVDLAMALDVLTNKADRAKDLAVWHQAMVLPQLIATPIGGAIRDGVARIACGGTGPKDDCDQGGCAVAYTTLFAVTAVYFLLSAAFVFRIRGVR